MSNNCLVCGPQQSGKTTLLNGVQGSQVEFALKEKHRESRWSTSNKYYEADICFFVVSDISHVASVCADASFCALVFVVDLALPQKDVRNILTLWRHELNLYLDSMDSRLLMGNYTHENISISEQKEFHTYLTNWALDNNFEFIPSPYLSHLNKPSKINWNGLFANYDSIELGSARLHAALQCVMWPAMKRRTSTNSRTTQDKSSSSLAMTDALNEQKEDLQSMATEDRSHDTSDTVTQLPAVSEAQGPSNIETPSDGKQSEGIEGGEEEEEKKQESESERRYLDEDDEHISEESDDQPTEVRDKSIMEQWLYEDENKKQFEDEIENDLSALQSLIDEMRSVRTQSLSGNLTHEERREKAAKTAMKLYRYMGLGDEEASSNDDMDRVFEDLQTQLFDDAADKAEDDMVDID